MYIIIIGFSIFLMTIIGLNYEEEEKNNKRRRRGLDLWVN